MSSTSNRPDFNLIMKVDHDTTKTWLWVSVMFVIAAVGVLKYSSYLYVSFVVRVVGFCAFLLILTTAILLLTYIGRLHFTGRNRLELNEEGLYDFASFCELEFVSMEAIANIRFAHLWGQEFLRVDFFPQANPLNNKHGFRAEVYRLFFGMELWVPVGLFEMSRIDLESQLIHLDHLLKRKTGGAIAGRTSISHNKANPPSATNSNPLAGMAGVDVKVETKGPKIDLRSASIQNSDKFPAPPEFPPLPRSGIAGRSAVDEGSPPPLTQVRPEKSRVLEKIENIKQQVRERGFDRMVANLYLDHVARFPMQMAGGRLPPGVSEVVASQQGADYEEVRYRYSGKMFSFGLRRDIGPSDEALLSVGIEGRVHLSLRVRVEIGELQPMDLESFIPGEWQSLVEQLSRTIDTLSKTKVELTVNQDGTQATSTNIEELKNRFGIEE